MRNKKNKHPLYELFKRWFSQNPKNNIFEISLLGSEFLKISSNHDNNLVSGIIIFDKTKTKIETITHKSNKIEKETLSDLKPFENELLQILSKLLELSNLSNTQPSALIRVFEKDLHICYINQNYRISGDWHLEIININYQEKREYVFNFSTQEYPKAFVFKTTDKKGNSISFVVSLEDRLIFHKEKCCYYNLSTTHLKSIKAITLKNFRGFAKYDKYSQKFLLNESCFNLD